MTKTVQVRKKGTLTIPSEMRKQYNIEEDDPITLVDTGEGIFLSPKRALLPKLVGEIESLMKKHKVSLDELIKNVQKERK